MTGVLIAAATDADTEDPGHESVGSASIQV